MCAVDHPFVASLYGTIQTGTHLHFLMEYCEGGELYGLLTTQPTKRLKEAHMRFYVAEVGIHPSCCFSWSVMLEATVLSVLRICKSAHSVAAFIVWSAC